MGHYIRFTEDIERDIKNKNSYNIHKQKLNGLCAWKISEDYNPYDNESIIEAAQKTAANIKKNSYCGYTSESNYAVVEGDMTGGYTNDGVLIKITRILGEFSI